MSECSFHDIGVVASKSIIVLVAACVLRSLAISGSRGRRKLPVSFLCVAFDDSEFMLFR